MANDMKTRSPTRPILKRTPDLRRKGTKPREPSLTSTHGVKELTLKEYLLSRRPTLSLR